MTQQTRRQFFKTIVATTVVAVVAPAVLVKKEPVTLNGVPIIPDSIQMEKIRGMGMTDCTRWHLNNFIDWDNVENQKTKTR